LRAEPGEYTIGGQAAAMVVKHVDRDE
jgi:hypothetical protein